MATVIRQATAEKYAEWLAENGEGPWSATYDEGMTAADFRAAMGLPAALDAFLYVVAHRDDGDLTLTWDGRTWVVRPGYSFTVTLHADGTIAPGEEIGPPLTR